MTAIDLCLLLVFGLFTVYVSASSQRRYDHLGFTGSNTDRLPPKPVRDDGLGSLLLKNLRFRDIERTLDEDRPLTNSLLWDLERLRDQVDTNQPDNVDMDKRVAADKRQAVSVSQLAELLHSLKSRGIDDDGVKLQSLRFGRK